MMFTFVRQMNQGHAWKQHVSTLTKSAQKSNSKDQLI
jgi:hypothetical protein